MPGYVYLLDKQNLYVNLFIESESNVEIGGRNIKLIQQTDYPWSGIINLKVGMDKASRFTLKDQGAGLGPRGGYSAWIVQISPAHAKRNFVGGKWKETGAYS